MCGRIEYIVTDRKKLEDRYNATFFEGYIDRPIPAHYNISPTQKTFLLTSDEPNHIVEGHWGFSPSWAKKEMKEVINARSETILEKPYFRGTLKNHRCLIPVTGFFEWKRSGTAKKPYRFFLKDEEIFSLAGIYSIHKDKNGDELPHYAILTTSANKLMHPIHNRMPVIVDKSVESHWLDPETDTEGAVSFLRPYDEKKMNTYEISTLVNNPKNNTKEVIKPINI